jgi:hypothetical protein
MELLKNPIFLGIIAFILVYLYFWYDKKRAFDGIKQRVSAAVNQGAMTLDQANQYLASLAEKMVPLFWPIVIGVLVAVIAYYLFCSHKKDQTYSEMMDNLSSDITIEVITAPSGRDDVNMNLWR